MATTTQPTTKTKTLPPTNNESVTAADQQQPNPMPDLAALRAQRKALDEQIKATRAVLPKADRIATEQAREEAVEQILTQCRSLLAATDLSMTSTSPNASDND